MKKTIILCKITGEVFIDRETKGLSSTAITGIISQMKQLSSTHQFGIVIGGGNFFRGNQHGKSLGISASVGHQIGMLATIMNGLILKDLLEQHAMPATLFCAMQSPQVGIAISEQSIQESLAHGQTLLFTGGTGNPFFTTDTNAILRGLQIKAQEVWKGTSVNGVYTKDPRKNADAQLIKHISYTQALKEKYGIMDQTAFALAEEYKQTVRIFNIFEPNALIRAAQQEDFGSIIQ